MEVDAYRAYRLDCERINGEYSKGKYQSWGIAKYHRRRAYRKYRAIKEWVADKLKEGNNGPNG